MNWDRGLFRAWVMMSLIWVVGYSGLVLGYDPPRPTPDAWFEFLLGVAVPPIVLLLLGLGIRWVARGFTKLKP